MSSEALKKRQQAADMMIAWYEGRKLPEGDLQISKWERILNVRKYADRSLNALRCHHVYSKEFVASYYRLYNLKKFIECTD